jgi:hypothetical protein
MVRNALYFTRKTDVSEVNIVSSTNRANLLLRADLWLRLISTLKMEVICPYKISVLL